MACLLKAVKKSRGKARTNEMGAAIQQERAGGPRQVRQGGQFCGSWLTASMERYRTHVPVSIIQVA
jgi:hypothetical protein